MIYHFFFNIIDDSYNLHSENPFPQWLIDSEETTYRISLDIEDINIYKDITSVFFDPGTQKIVERDVENLNMSLPVLEDIVNDYAENPESYDEESLSIIKEYAASRFGRSFVDSVFEDGIIDPEEKEILLNKINELQ